VTSFCCAQNFVDLTPNSALGWGLGFMDRDGGQIGGWVEDRRVTKPMQITRAL
jgi:hypothetical protein